MIPMTMQGLVQLQKQLHHLKSVDRPAILAEVSKARKFGDLSENAEYHAAREKQRYIERRIQDLEYRVVHAQVIDISSFEGPEIRFGATVELYDEDKEERVTYQIVGVDEANIEQKKLAITSALARELIGKEEGMTIELTTLRGEKTYRIEKVQYLVAPSS